MGNILKSYVLLGLLTSLLIVLGNILGGPGGVAIAIVISLVMNIISYWFSDRIVLSMYGAQEIGPNHPSRLYELVQRLSQRAGLPMPRVYIVPSQSPNAFATGRNAEHAAVAATEGLINALSYEEIEGVMAHEITHIKNKDTLISTLAAVIASSIMHIVSLAKWAMIFGGGSRDDNENSGGLLGTILLLVITPIAAILIQAAISRSREYMADKGAKSLIGTGTPLANALRKIEEMSLRGYALDAAPATSHMFIINPLTTKSVLTLFSTHPATEDRIQKLIYEN